MSRPARIGGHPLHPILVSLPVGLWSFSLICDLMGIIQRENSLWQSVAFYALVGGTIGALLAALPGVIDLLALKRPYLRRIGLTHMTLNLIVIAIFVGDIALRASDAIGIIGPAIVSVIGIALLAVSAWLGGELVYRYGAAVDLTHVRGARHTLREASGVHRTANGEQRTADAHRAWPQYHVRLR
jgi:uncharacterized membrane protein